MRPGSGWIHFDGSERPLTYGDLRIVSPYNAQVAALRTAIPFKNEELVDYLTALQVDKSAYEYVPYESEVEREFARKLDQREDIKLAHDFCRGFFSWYNTEHRHSGIA